MTEEQIERRVEKQTDRIDRYFMNGDITREEYDERIKELSAWAEKQYDDACNQRGESDLDLLLLGGCIMALIFLIGGLWMDGTIRFEPWQFIRNTIEMAGRP
jgi:hypothetical protein